MIKSRFQQEISGDLGEWWVRHAQKELDGLRDDLAEGKIVIDNNGVARNSIGRAVMADMLEKLLYIAPEGLDEEATRDARESEVAAYIEEYKRNYTGPSEEELAEMRAEFGLGEVIVNVLTGTRIQL